MTMSTLLLLLVVLSASASALPSSSTMQSFLREPFDQIASVGEHVTLPCRVVRKQGVLQWTRDDFGLGSDRGLEGFRRYTMTGSDEEGKPRGTRGPGTTGSQKSPYARASLGQAIWKIRHQKYYTRKLDLIYSNGKKRLQRRIRTFYKRVAVIKRIL